MNKKCPKCGADISDSYQAADHDVGIMCSGWYCEECDLPIEDDRDDDGYLDYCSNEAI